MSIIIKSSSYRNNSPLPSVVRALLLTRGCGFSAGSRRSPNQYANGVWPGRCPMDLWRTASPAEWERGLCRACSSHRTNMSEIPFRREKQSLAPAESVEYYGVCREPAKRYEYQRRGLLPFKAKSDTGGWEENRIRAGSIISIHVKTAKPAIPGNASD